MDISNLYVNYESLDYYRYMPSDLKLTPRKINFMYVQGDHMTLRISAQFINNNKINVYGRWKNDSEGYKLCIYLKNKDIKDNIDDIIKIIIFSENEMLVRDKSILLGKVMVRVGISKI